MDDERCKFPARSQAWPRARAYLEARCQALGVPRSATLRLEIIAEELFINSAIHGGQGVGAEISLLVRDAGVDIELVVEDGAAAFNPFDGPEPPSASTNPDERPVGRLGRALVVGLCSRSRYERLDGRNRVTVGVFKAVGAARSRG